MTERAPVRQPPVGATSSPPVEDLRRELEAQRFVDLRVASTPPLDGASVRAFTGGTVDDVPLKAGVANVLPHGLGRRVRDVQFTLFGDARAWVGTTPPQGYDPSQVVAVFVSSNVTAHLRAR